MLSSSVHPTVVAISSDNSTSTIYTIIQKIFQEKSNNKKTPEDTKGHKYDCDDISLSLASLSFQHDNNLIEKDDFKTQ